MHEYINGVKLAFEEFIKAAAKRGEKVEPGSLKGGPSEPAASAPAGEGKRFEALVEKLKKKAETLKMGGKIRDPEALAAAIGRAKFGKKKFQEMAAAGRRRVAKK